jgi:hypothetical protein
MTVSPCRRRGVGDDAEIVERAAFLYGSLYAHLRRPGDEERGR